MIKAKYLNAIDPVDFTIEFNDEGKIVRTSNEDYKDFIKNLDDTLDMAPLGPIKNITFDDATERELVLYYSMHEDYEVESYPDDIELTQDVDVEDDTVI